MNYTQRRTFHYGDKATVGKHKGRDTQGERKNKRCAWAMKP